MASFRKRELSVTVERLHISPNLFFSLVCKHQGRWKLFLPPPPCLSSLDDSSQMLRNTRREVDSFITISIDDVTDLCVSDFWIEKQNEKRDRKFIWVNRSGKRRKTRTEMRRQMSMMTGRSLKLSCCSFLDFTDSVVSLWKLKFIYCCWKTIWMKNEGKSALSEECFI